MDAGSSLFSRGTAVGDGTPRGSRAPSVHTNRDEVPAPLTESDADRLSLCPLNVRLGISSEAPPCGRPRPLQARRLSGRAQSGAAKAPPGGSAVLPPPARSASPPRLHRGVAIIGRPRRRTAPSSSPSTVTSRCTGARPLTLIPPGQTVRGLSRHGSNAIAESPG